MKNLYFLYLNILIWLERYGTQVGVVLLVAPLVYDVVGWIYGRHYGIGVGNIGAIIQIIGAVLMLGGRYARRWGR